MTGLNFALTSVVWAIIHGVMNVKDVSYSFEIVKVTHYALFTV